MRNYMSEYLRYIDDLLKNGCFDPQSLKQQHLIKIQFFQHERLIHLLVTCLFAVMLFISLGLMTIFKSPAFMLLFLLILLLLIPYVIHYYFLENGVQKMYRQYDIISKGDTDEKNKNSWYCKISLFLYDNHYGYSLGCHNLSCQLFNKGCWKKFNNRYYRWKNYYWSQLALQS